jgi:hypothetical protein
MGRTCTQEDFGMDDEAKALFADWDGYYPICAPNTKDIAINGSDFNTISS